MSRAVEEVLLNCKEEMQLQTHGNIGGSVVSAILKR